METLRGTEPGRLAAQIRALAVPALGGDGRASEALAELLERQNPIDVARILGELEREEVTLVFDLLDRERQGVVLPEAGPKEQALLLMHVGERGSQLLARLEPDDAADVLDALEAEDREALLRDLEAEDEREIRELREYGPETAGGLMTPQAVIVPPDATQREIIRQIRQEAEAETINIIYVADRGKLVGVVSIRDVLLAPPEAAVRDYLTPEVIQVRPDADQEEVIRLMETYHLGAIPVVDRTGRLLGMVTADDALSALEEEASEDVMALAGAGAHTAQTVRERIRARLPWLLFTLFGGIAAGWIIRLLGESFGKPGVVEPTARLLPLIAGLAGNVGMQSSAVMLRGFATGEIHRSRVRTMVGEEVLVAVLNGCLCGLVSGLMALTITGTPGLDRFLAVAISVTLAATAAGTVGAVLPSACERFGVDPAVSAGPFITTLNDVLGFTIYLTVSLGAFGLQD